MKKHIVLFLAMICFITSGALAAKGFVLLSIVAAGIGGGILASKDRSVELSNAEQTMQALAIMFHTYRLKYEKSGGTRDREVLIETLAADISEVGEVINNKEAMLHTSACLGEAFTIAKKRENLTC